MALNDVYELVQYGTLGSVQVANAFHLIDNGGGGSPANLAADWLANAVTPWKAAVATQWAPNLIAVKRIVPHDLLTAYAIPAGTGAVGAQVCPVVVAGVITWRTGYSGRRARGRTYVGGMAVDAYATAASAVWNATGVGRLNTLANALLTRYSLGGNPIPYLLGVYSRADGIVGGVWTVAGFRQATSFTPQSYICTMGSRRYGHGI